MTRWNTNISDEQIEAIRRMRANGVGWELIQRKTGFSWYIARTRIDPVFAASVRARVNEARRADRVGYRRNVSGYRFADIGRLTPEEVKRAVATVPADTRGLTGRLLGDPLPGRSALDKNAQARRKFSTEDGGAGRSRSIATDFSSELMRDRHSREETVR